MSPTPLHLLRPRLPNADALLPYLRQIDANAYYTNFGPLNNSLLHRLTTWQTSRFGRPVSGVMTSSATLGLELLLADLRLPPGSRIVLPALTFVATATAILRCGHVPVVADVDAKTWLLSPDTLPKNINQQTIGAVMPVAAFGMPQSAKDWSEWSKRTGVPVIIDAAGAFGAQSAHDNVAVVFSLHATKCLSSGEGGLIVTESPEQACRLTQMTNFGIGADTSVGGTNAKMSEYHAAVGHADFDGWPQRSQRRIELHDQYQAALRQACGQAISFQQDSGLCSPSMMVVRFANPTVRDLVEQRCALDGIQTRRWYQPLIQDFPALRGVETTIPTPKARHLARRLLGLPFHLDMTQREIRRVADVLTQEISRLSAQEIPITSNQP